LLVVTAVEAERVACAGTPAWVISSGVGPVAAAAATAAALAREPIDLVISVYAALGAASAGGFLPISALGYGDERYAIDPMLVKELTERTGGRAGTILTVSTVTGTAATTRAMSSRFPDALAEAMEGAGVAEAARQYDVPYAEVRCISNLVGPRDRMAWRVPEALDALSEAMASIGELT
jgi:futalosine hydrolase